MAAFRILRYSHRMPEKTPPPRTVKNYAEGITTRNNERVEAKKAKPLFPNFGQAAVSHDPKRNVTLGQIGEEQRAAAAAGEEERPPGLSEATLQGLAAVQRANTEAKPAEPVVPAEPDAEPDVDLGEPMETSANFELATVLKRLREQQAKDSKSKKVLEKLLVPINLSDGLLSGEFKQSVPIITDQLTVVYRSLSSLEMYHIRKMVREYLGENPELSNLENELLGLYQTIASVVKFNKTEQKPHLVMQPSGIPIFDTPTFAEKVARFMLFPYQLLGVLSTHGSWFDERVRALFETTDAIKNG